MRSLMNLEISRVEKQFVTPAYRLVKTTDQKNNSFKCSMCQGAHKNAEFPVSEIAKRLMETMPTEVFRSVLVGTR